ncbi:MAG: DHH family phosphoesterase [bacterium]
MDKKILNYTDFRHPYFKSALAKVRGADNILVWGDEDPDGITATAIMVRCLRRIGKNVIYHIPSRKKEGIGLNRKKLKYFIDRREFDLLITVDCGSVNAEEIQYLNECSKDVIITDHHIPYKGRYDSAEIINPHILNNESFTHLAGAGVALIFAVYLEKQILQFRQYNDVLADNEYYLVLASIGTKCDRVTIKGLNQSIIKYIDMTYKYFPVLAAVGEDEICGLVHQSKTERNKNPLVEIFTGRYSQKRAEQTVRKLVSRKKRAERKMERLKKQAFDRADASGSFIIYIDRTMDGGFAGLIASALKDRYKKPCCVIAKRNSDLIGEARSDGEINWVDTLSGFSDYFQNWGGHKQAAGFTIKEERLDEFINSITADIDNLQ